MSRTRALDTRTRTHIVFEDPETLRLAFERAGEEQFEDRQNLQTSLRYLDLLQSPKD